MAKQPQAVRAPKQQRKSASAGPDWVGLLEEALTRPGRISEAYSAFHSFSIGNRILAALQLAERKLPLAPIASFKAWQAKGRQVRKGEKAISLVMPVTVKRERQVTNELGEVETKFERATVFVLRPRWFSYDQTEPMQGVEQTPEPPRELPLWNRAKALEALGVTEASFDLLDGNTQGYARPSKRIIAINPMAANPLKTTFHELAHCLLHADQDRIVDGAELPRSLLEVEAEAVAYLCCASLGHTGLEECRGYIQSYLMLCRGRTDEIRTRHAMRIFRATDQILKAGANSAPEDEDHANDEES